eukprot:scaffold17517_cov105-Skeletonema_dohrnii-CCMP3373.AAC.2
MNGLDVQMISNDLARAMKEAEADGRQVDLNAFFEKASLNNPNNKEAISFVKGHSDLRNLSSELKRAKEEAVGELDTEEFLDQFLKTNPDKHVAIRKYRANNSILVKKKRNLSAVIQSVENEAKASNVEECELDCSIYKCVECTKKRSEEYTSLHYSVAADHEGNKQMRCLLCGESNSIRSGLFRRVGLILFKDVLDERLKLDELSKQEKKKSAPKRKKKSAPKRKVEAATSSTSKKRKLSDGANSERLADAGGPDDDKSCSDCCYHLGTGQWKLRIRNGKLM